jgi:hypothetical protein
LALFNDLLIYGCTVPVLPHYASDLGAQRNSAEEYFIAPLLVACCLQLSFVWIFSFSFDFQEQANFKWESCLARTLQVCSLPHRCSASSLIVLAVVSPC